MGTFSAKKLLDRRLADPAFREEWEGTELAREVAALVLLYRAEHGLTQAQLAERLGVKQSAVARLESGEVNPSMQTLLRLVERLQAPMRLELRPPTSRMRRARVAATWGPGAPMDVRLPPVIDVRGGTRKSGNRQNVRSTVATGSVTEAGMAKTRGSGDRLHVTKQPGGGWGVKPEGNDVASRHRTQGAAESAAKARLERTPGGGQVITHRPDGTIRDADTINRADPNPPRDTRH